MSRLAARWRSLKRPLAHLRDASGWRPEHARLLWFQLADRDRNRAAGSSDRDHLVAAAQWLARAQDVMQDGGVGGRYRLRGGWTSSYPETTGYIIPTFQALARELPDPSFAARAERCVEFLLGLQLPAGAFPAGEVHENTTRPSVFNTAQILSGLAARLDASPSEPLRNAAHRAADWLVAMQDPDGAWRKHVFLDVAATYHAHASCWLAEFGRQTGVQRYLDAAERHLDWVLAQRDPATDWIDLAGFAAEDHRARRAVTHGIAYTLAGALRTAAVLGRADGLQAVAAAADRVLRRLELSGWLPGVLDHRWRGAAPYACLTGNAQMALVWFELYRHDPDPRLLNAAFKAIDLVKQAQPLWSRDPDLRGAIPGSAPVWGDYLYCALPNWAAKFFIDALLEKERVLATLAERPRQGWDVPADVPRALPHAPAASGPDRRPLRVVLYSSPRSHKVPQMVSRWAAWGFVPAAVVFERPVPPRLRERIVTKVRAAGLRGLFAALRARRAARAPTDRPSADTPAQDAIAYCRARGIPWFEVAALESAEGHALVRRLAPDLAVHAGAGILRAGLLALPRLGTLNAHMGLLPYYRGMNVSEWAAFNGDPVGCTVHLVDPGLDTGPILCVRMVDGDATRSIAELRRVVDEAQIALLGEVVRFALERGVLPPGRSQRAEEGVQFFRLHPELATRLERELADDGRATDPLVAATSG